MNQEISFGAFVRQRRREMDLTQEELARRVGCASITLRKIEADDLRPPAFPVGQFEISEAVDELFRPGDAGNPFDRGQIVLRERPGRLHIR